MKAHLEQAIIFNAVSSFKNFEMQIYYQKEPKLNGAFSKNNLLKKKEGAYVINFDEFISIGIHWIALYVNFNNASYFESFEVENIPKEI